MYRMSTTNDLVIRMRCGNGNTVGCKLGNGKDLWEGRGFEKVEEICRRVENRTLKTEGSASGQQSLVHKRLSGTDQLGECPVMGKCRESSVSLSWHPGSAY